MAAPTIQTVPLARADRSVPTESTRQRTRNRILGLLPPAELEEVLGLCERVSVRSKEIVFRRGESIPYVYFPEDCVISLVTELDNGDAVEAMTVGSDGFAGIAVFHGVSASRLKGLGQITGEALRLSTADFKQLTDSCPELERVLHRYSQFVFETVSQSAACNRLHVIEQRCARWLLMSQDRVGRDEFNLTQEFLAEMLGVRRPGVTVAMGELEKAGLIAHSRGMIAVVDRPGLENASCECYRTIRDRQSELIS
ncbi:MAG TPA: Crp/Fnr family transcriptional regulator [Gemmatimonadaceae bacterium]|nr:Crp/Fnr family transcriptional regulator [Gemmatimonadaceae bacterium]